MVDIVNHSLRVHKLNQVFNNLNDVFLRQNTHADVRRQVQLLVHTVAAHFTQVVALLGEEEVVDDLACASIVGRISVAKLAIDVEHSLLLGVTGILIQRIEDNGIVGLTSLFAVDKDGLHTSIQNFVHDILVDERLTLKENLVTLDGNHFASIGIHEVFHADLNDTGGKLTAYQLLGHSLVDTHLFSQIEDLKDVLIRLKADSAKQRGDGEFLLAVDVGIHDIVDVRSKLNPRAFERDNTSGIKRRAIGMDTLSEEDARRTMQLRNHNALGAVDNECSLLGHVGNGAKIHILNDGIEILMVGVGAIELQLRLEGDVIGKALLQTLFDRVTGRVDIIVKKLKNEVVAGIGDWEILGKHLVETVVLAQLGRSI